MRSAGGRAIVRSEDRVSCVMHAILESHLRSQVFAIEQIRCVDGVHHIAESRETLNPECHVIGGHELLFAERKHQIFESDRTCKWWVRTIRRLVFIEAIRAA